MITFVESAEVEATTGRMLVTFWSGDEALKFHLPGNVALLFRQRVMADAWQVCCVPDAEPIPFKRGKRK